MIGDTWESYYVPGTYDPATGDGTLENLLGESDPQALRHREYSYTKRRMVELRDGTTAIPQTFDAEHLKAIHKYLFQDVYQWAGQWRTVDMAKDVTDFLGVHQIDSYLADMARYVAHTHWDWLSRRETVEELSTVFALLNHAHPFREGNGRASRMFLRDIAARSHFEVKFARVGRDLWNQASAFSGPDRGAHWPHPEELYPVFNKIVVPRQPAQPNSLVASALAAQQTAQTAPMSTAKTLRPAPPAVPAMPASQVAHL